ncbi:MAG: [FeFe] hydrogenase H-cluster radical SAM maturase HydE [Lachnospiraceae bacterium]|nr:[FeFe] hydrogenase H-cluster radical SAM maturase HydE [Lachnospiraceae bacterium]
MQTQKMLIDKLANTKTLSKEEWITLIDGHDADSAAYLFAQARDIRHQHYGKEVFQRGLIEFTNYCKQDCFYCGIRKSNPEVVRYRLSEAEILSCCELGYELGFRTFVLQGGEDNFFTDERLSHIIAHIHQAFPDCAITLSIGERSFASYQTLFKAGAQRFLLRHETHNHAHYATLHPENLSARKRQACLWDLKKIGFEVGTGFMVGSPFQTSAHLAEDMLFLKKLNPQMIGIGPFIPHHATPFHDQCAGTLELTLFMIGLIRLMLPKVLLPSTTSLGTIATDGREKGILAGANVVMPNLSPINTRKNYQLYDNKICLDDDARDCRQCMENRMNTIGYKIVVCKGDSLNLDERNVAYV